jgi:hypothetical protein
MSVPGMLRAITDAANARFPFGYEVGDDADAYSLLPTRTRSKGGTSIAVRPLLDRSVTIPEGVRPIYDSARLMAASLTTQVGMPVSCCQPVIAGVPWGVKSVAFAAREEPARRILRRLIRANFQRAYWLVRCAPSGAGCVIQVKDIQPRVEMHVFR